MSRSRHGFGDATALLYGQPRRYICGWADGQALTRSRSHAPEAPVLKCFETCRFKPIMEDETEEMQHATVLFSLTHIRHAARIVY
jgi:hypothetical protein